jgi:hypothetical protein
MTLVPILRGRARKGADHRRIIADPWHGRMIHEGAKVGICGFSEVGFDPEPNHLKDSRFSRIEHGCRG